MKHVNSVATVENGVAVDDVDGLQQHTRRWVRIATAVRIKEQIKSMWSAPNAWHKIVHRCSSVGIHLSDNETGRSNIMQVLVAAFKPTGNGDMNSERHADNIQQRSGTASKDTGDGD